jgi:FKBP-type peptidyl-prolyl cis-trans isomerase 2
MPVAGRGPGRVRLTELEPGMRVVHPGQPDWGEGQVQSVIGERVTVNFEHRGKVLINVANVRLDVVDGP